MALSESELAEVRLARERLEAEGLALRLTDLVGRPIEWGLERIPAGALEQVHKATRAALESALRVALGTLGKDAAPSHERLHRWASVASGAVGGLFGMGGVAVELPVTTVIMLRSIADIARSEGQDLRSPEVSLACIEVFALGGPGRRDDAAETGYYAVRAALAKSLGDAARHVAQRGLTREGAPALVRLVEAIAARFGIVVQEKVALGAVPLLGAVSGSLVNAVFMDHFQSRARGHFVIRRLEARHGAAAVREAWERAGPTAAA